MPNVIDGDFVSYEIVDGTVQSSILVDLEPNSVQVIEGTVESSSLVSASVSSTSTIESQLYTSTLLIEVADRLKGTFKRLFYDADTGDLIKIEYWNSSSLVNKIAEKTFTYQNGQLTQITLTLDDVPSITTLVYDDGDLVSVG